MSSILYSFHLESHPRLRIDVEMYSPEVIHLHCVDDNPNVESKPSVALTLEEDHCWLLEARDWKASMRLRKDAIFAAMGHCAEALGVHAADLVEVTAFLERTLPPQEPSAVILPESRVLEHQPEAIALES